MENNKHIINTIDLLTRSGTGIIDTMRKVHNKRGLSSNNKSAGQDNRNSTINPRMEVVMQDFNGMDLETQSECMIRIMKTIKKFRKKE